MAELTQLRGEVVELRRENLELRQQVGYWKGNAFARPIAPTANGCGA